MKKKTTAKIIQIALFAIIAVTGVALWFFLDSVHQPVLPSKLTDSERIQKISWYSQEIRKAEQRIAEIGIERRRPTLMYDQALKKLDTGHSNLAAEDRVSQVADPRQNVISRERVRQLGQEMVDEATLESEHYRQILDKLANEEQGLRTQMANFRQKLAEYPNLKRWTNQNGKSVEAFIVRASQQQMDIVDLNGQIYNVSIDQLIPEDQAYAALFAIGYCPENDLARAFQAGNIQAIALYQKAYAGQLTTRMRESSKIAKALESPSAQEPAIQILQAIAKGSNPKLHDSANPQSLYYITPEGEQDILIQYFK